MANVEAHITGTVWKVEVKVGDQIEEGDTVVILESMKMEMPVEAEDEGTVGGDPLRGGPGGQRGRHARRARVSARPWTRSPAGSSGSTSPRRTSSGSRSTTRRSATRSTTTSSTRSPACCPRLDARCLLVTGTGPGLLRRLRHRRAAAERGASPTAAEAIVAHPFAAAIAALDAFPRPVVAALNGHAIGGGLELALSCDLRVCSDAARLGMPPARLGLVYSHTGLRKFLDAIGAPRTRELFFTARTIERARGAAWGLVGEVVPPGTSAAPRGGARRRDRRERAALARREQARDPRAARRRGRARARGGGGARRAARGVLRARRTSARASARSRRSAPPRWQGR